MKSCLILFLALAFPIQAQSLKETVNREKNFSQAEVAALAISMQTDPKKLAALKGERAANPRLQRCIYWLAKTEDEGNSPEAVLAMASLRNGTSGTDYAGFIKWGLLENLRLAKEYGILTPEGMAELRRGKTATITRGQYAGQEAAADHVIPLKVAPELGNQVLNLELLPASLNSAKGAKVGKRQVVFAGELRAAGLLSEAGYQAVLTAAGGKQ